MKSLYKSPEISVEELAKQDVLCSSSVNSEEQDNGSIDLLSFALKELALS